ncbi:RAB6A-GEF complex partner protein 2-like isoform X1 [Petromyzon marinus]|uniref:RAB6A-GEF complex partner protein 2-like isoform X1 n=1 Tax=Petromyzon marinus TaxID=7757 RepID=UPI003F71908A
MIEVVAKITRGPVFLAGETLECLVTFTNPMGPHATSASCETLAWASAQIHCQFHASESRVALPPTPTAGPDVQAESDTVFVPNRGERGQCVLSTTPKILFCDLQLAPGDSKAYTYSETIPLDAPPSFRGQAVKYAYKLTVGCQRVNSPIKLLRVPFRVLVLQDILPVGLSEYHLSADDDTVAPANPFLDDDDDDDDTDSDDGNDADGEGGGQESGERGEGRLLDLAADMITVATAQRSQSVFNITSPWGKVGRLSVARSAFRLGEDAVCSFDFSAGDVRCLRVTVLLQAEESVAPALRRRPSQAPAVATHARHHELCLHTARTHAALPVPLHATPSFSTHVVTLKWRLHFQFLVACEPEATPTLAMEASEGSLWRGAERVQADTLSWDLPITVLPTNPLQAASGSPTQACNSVVI